jgi:hypothetical protein
MIIGDDAFVSMLCAVTFYGSTSNHVHGTRVTAKSDKNETEVAQHLPLKIAKSGATSECKKIKMTCRM